MKVLLTHERFAPDFAGGGELVALETARNLISRGINVQVVTTGDPEVTAYENIPTARVPVHRYRFNFAVEEIVSRARGAALIHTFNYHACWPSLRAARRLGIPCVCTILGLFGQVWRQMRPGVGRAYALMERFLLTRRFSHVLFPSDYSRDVGLSLGVSASRSGVSMPGINLAAYRADLLKKEDRVLYVGQLHPRKGVYDILTAARALPSVQFRLFGWSSVRVDWRKLAPRNVEIIPFERGQRLYEEFAKARIFFFPSRAETFGFAVLEAMASGCAIVSTVPLNYEGATVAPGDQSAMIAAVKRLWDDRDGSLRMGQRNCELADSFTWVNYTDSVLKSYHRVLGAHRFA